MKNKIEEIKTKILNKDSFLLEVQKSIYNKYCGPIEINKEVLNLAYTTIFSYREILLAYEIIQDIKRLKISNEDMNEISRNELLNDICILATSFGRTPMEFAIRFWSDSEKYSDELKTDILETISKLKELANGRKQI